MLSFSAPNTWCLSSASGDNSPYKNPQLSLTSKVEQSSNNRSSVHEIGGCGGWSVGTTWAARK